MHQKIQAPETGQGSVFSNIYNNKKITINVPVGDKTLEIHLTMKQALKLVDDIYKQMGVII
ncbi:MAG: hypothetical protein JHC26_09890 [Thermofilum sp.]|jgi:hypothetical protein|uniref:hypothetical protein n=1 Tax=Thermofilum sp. TaxID=1961369 RepID=UPI0025837705|nr:hypothetical protein [Thermofilum sp.]MCI4409393.1 hypothetical protein [Thermofilum sp.]